VKKVGNRNGKNIKRKTRGKKRAIRAKFQRGFLGKKKGKRGCGKRGGKSKKRKT